MADCDSCGRETPDQQLTSVQRAYFFDADDPEPDIRPEIEQWCASCCHTYPHVLAEDSSG